jgi:NADH:ubiquinone oxidoreductase subunit K
MPLERWRALKGAFYSLIIAGLAVLFTVWRGNWIVFVATVVAILLITTLEVKEVEVMDAISVTLYRNRRRDQPDETDSGND